ncbi:WD40 repeat protein [Micromonospora olivasterospora]|uniref:WD40 repeat protein n=1 Tax=Micromonospora olivasterospora TaxID=1880 RepID=A0A562IF90_MICOL|nr:WD40 repeat protein [Micromonospora olivasterospora]
MVAQRQAVTDAEAWAARAVERTWDRSADELLDEVQGRGGVWRVVLAFGDRGHEGVLDLVGRLLDGRLSGVRVPATAVIELSPYGAGPLVEPRTVVEVAALRVRRGQSGAVAIRSRYVAGAVARSVPQGLIPVDFSGRETFAGGALLWEFHARPIRPEDARSAQFYREARGLHGAHAPYLLPPDRRWARFGQRAASYMRDWVFPPVPSSGLGRWRVVELRQAGLLAGESVAGATPDVGPVGWVPDGARVLVVGVPGPHPVHPTAVVDTLFDTFLNSALPPVESGLREPVYVVVHGFGGRVSPVVLAHVAEGDLWPVRLGEMAAGEPVVGTREVSNLVEAQSWTRVRSELPPIAAALQPGGAAEQWRARVPELTAMLPDVTVTDPVAVDLSTPDAAGTAGVRAHRRMGERVEQLVALGEELVRHTREWVGGAGETDRLDLRLEEWAGHRDSQQLVTALARAGRLTGEVEGLVADQIGRVWAAAVPPGIVLAGEGATVPDAVRDVLRAVYLGAWVLSTGSDGPVVVRGYGGWQRADLSHMRLRSGAEFTRFLADHGGDVALLWSADGPADPGAQVSRLRAALDVPLVPRRVDVVGRVPGVSEQRSAELLSAVSAFGLARELLEEQIRLLPARAAVLPGQASVTVPPPQPAPSPHAGDAPVLYEWVAGPDGVVPGGGQPSAGGLPEWMHRGDRRGDGLLCLLDSLAQTLSGVRPGLYRGFDNVETRAQALLDRMEGRLGSDHVVIRDLRSARGAEVYSGGFLNELAELFQVRVQVVEQGGDRRWYGHPVVGRDGNAPLMLVEFVSPGGRGGLADEEMGTFYPLFVDTVHAAALGGAATITDHLIQRWEALVGGHAARIDRLEAAERPLVEAAERGQDVGQARSVLDRLSGRYLDGLRDLRLARGLRDMSEYVRSVSDIAALSGRIGRVEAAAAELDAHVGQAPAGAATPPPAVVSPQLLTGHTGAVWAVTSWQEESGRRLLASASTDRSVRIWDAADGRLVGTLEGHTGTVSAVTSWQEASGRRMLASAGADRSVRIWDAADGRLLQTLRGHTGPVRAVTSWQEESGRRLLASASLDETVRIWDAADGRLIRTLDGHTGTVLAVTSWQEESGRRLLASASGDETVRIWDAADGRLLQTFRGHTDAVWAVTSWQEESGRRLLASAGEDRTVRIWDAADDRPVRTLAGHTGTVRAVTSWQEGPGRRLLASASGDRTVRIWDAADGRLLRTLEGHTGTVFAVTSWQEESGRQVLASASADRTVRLWTLPDGVAGLAGLPAVPGGRVAAGNDPAPVPATSVGELSGRVGRVEAAAVESDAHVGQAPAGAATPPPVVSPQLLTGYTGTVFAVTSWQEESGRRLLAAAGDERTVRIWDAAGGRLVGTLEGHTGPVLAVTSWQEESGRRLVASASLDETVRIWDAADGRLLQTLEGHTDEVLAVTSWQEESGRRLLASASLDETVRIWDAADGSLLRTLAGHTGAVSAVTSWQEASGRRLLASASVDETVRIWDAADGSLLRTLEGHTDTVSAVTSWQDESGRQLLASASVDETVRIWDAADGRLVRTLEGHTDTVSAVTSWQEGPGRRLLASASMDETVRIWDAADGRLVRTLEGHTDEVLAVTSWPEESGGRMLASAGGDQTVRLWPLPDAAAGLAGLPAVPGGRVAAGNDPAPVPATSVGELRSRIGQGEAAAAEPDAHVGQAPAGAATPPPAVVSPQLLTGHTDTVSAVTSWQEASGQRLLASAGDERTVRIWDAADGRLVGTLEGHSGPVWAVTSWQEASGRRMLASASGDQTVRIWDAADGRLIRTLEGHTRTVWAVTSWQEESGRRMLASASGDQTVRIWDAADGRLIRTLEGHTEWVRAVTSWQEESGQRLLASASGDETVRIWDAADGRLLQTLEGHTDEVFAVTSWQEESGQRLLASASGDRTVRIWDAADGRLVRTLEGHTDEVSAVTSWQEASGQRLLASASGDRTVRIWDAADGRLVRTLEGHTDWVLAVTSWPEESGGRMLASAGGDQTVRLWPLPDSAAGLAGLPAVPGGRAAAGNDPAPVPATSVGELSGRIGRVEAAAAELDAHIGQTPAGAATPPPVVPPQLLTGHTEEVRAVTSWQETSGQRMVASASDDRTVRIWDAADGRLVRTLEGHTDEVLAVTSWQEESGRRLLASASVDETVRIWDAADGRLLRTLEGHTDEVLAVTSWQEESGRRLLASASVDETVRIWDAAVGRLLQTLAGHTDAVSAVTSWQEESGQRLLASASADETVRIWDAADGRLLQTLDGHTDPVFAVTSWQAASGQRLLASASWDETVRIWDAADGRLLQTLEGHTRPVSAVTSWQAASGQRLLASASGDQTVRIWDAADGRLLQTLEGHTDWVWAVMSWPAGRAGGCWPPPAGIGRCGCGPCRMVLRGWRGCLPCRVGGLPLETTPHLCPRPVSGR